MTTEYQISYSSHSRVRLDQHATSIVLQRKTVDAQKEYNAKRNVSEGQRTNAMHLQNCNCQLVTHNSFSSTYPQTKSLHNILYPIAHHYSLIHFRSEKKRLGSRTATLPNHSKPNRGCSNTTIVITTAIARANWITMDADHEATARAPASLFFKEASQTESSSCSWLGLRDE